MVRIRDVSLSERLYVNGSGDDANKKAKTVVQQREAVHEQQVTIKGGRLEAPQLFEAVGQKNQIGTKKKTSTPSKKLCTRCGKDQHPRNACPSKEATCRKCQKKGHFAVMC